jgi:hypothetical protein
MDAGAGRRTGRGQGGGSGRDGDFAAEFDKGLHSAVVFAAVAGLVAAGEGEGVGIVGEVAEGAAAAVAFTGGRGQLVEVAPHGPVDEGGFDGGVAAEAPLSGDDLLDEVVFDGVGGLESLEVGLVEELEVLAVLVVEEEALVGAEAVGGMVAGGDGFALRGNGALGFGAVAAGGFALFFSALFWFMAWNFVHGDLSTHRYIALGGGRPEFGFHKQMTIKEK